ncbi:TPA: hypothetical protein ACH3X2_012352 [Trebouxia sp. C0005]
MLIADVSIVTPSAAAAAGFSGSFKIQQTVSPLRTLRLSPRFNRFQNSPAAIAAAKAAIVAKQAADEAAAAEELWQTEMAAEKFVPME